MSRIWEGGGRTIPIWADRVYTWVMFYDLVHTRKRIIQGWDLSYIVLPDREKTNLAQLWNELKRVEAADAWRSLCALSGQVIEALLRQKLVIEGYYDFSQVSGQTLGPLIDMARRVGLFPAYGAPPSAKSSITTAHTLRNWASHYALWYDYPTELRATQSLVLTVAAVEGLFPKTSPVFTQPPPDASNSWWARNWHSVAPASLISRLRASDRDDILRSVLSSLDRFYAHIMRYGMPSSVVKLLELARDEKLDQDLLRQSINDQFHDIVCNASRSSIDRILETVWRLRKIGLQAHATLLSTLLPFDDSIFKRLLDTRSPAWVARYVAECFRAEPDVFAATAGDVRKMQRAVTAFWRRFGTPSGNILNAANILGKMPPQLRVSILEQAPLARLLQWVRGSDPRDSVNLLSSLDEHIISLAPHLTALRDQVVQEICGRVHSASCSQLHELPLRLHRLDVAHEEIGAKVLCEVLNAVRTGAKSDPDWNAIRRILWDTYIFCDRLGRDTVRLAQDLITRKGPSIPQWNRLCFIGLLEIAAQGTCSIPEICNEDDFLQRISDNESDRWQRFLAALGFSCIARRWGLTLPARAIPVLRELHADTEEPEIPASKRLLEEVGRIVKVPP